MAINTRYGALDTAILSALSDGPLHFTHLIANRQVSKEADNATTPTRPRGSSSMSGPREPHRTLDRRLQAMRRVGKIQFDSKKGWTRS